MGTLLARHRGRPATRVETSLDTVGTSACATSVLRTNLPCKRIPGTGAKDVKGPGARWVPDQIRAAQQVERQVHGLRQGNSQPGTGLDEIRPILAFGDRKSTRLNSSH